MAAGSLGGITVSPDDGACAWALDGADERRAVCTHPTAAFAPNTSYAVTVSTGVTDRAGIPLTEPFTFGFTTGAIPDTTAPTVIASTPEDGATAIQPSEALQLIFSEPMNTTSVQAALSITAPSGTTPINHRGGHGHCRRLDEPQDRRGSRHRDGLHRGPLLRAVGLTGR